MGECLCGLNRGVEGRRGIEFRWEVLVVAHPDRWHQNCVMFVFAAAEMFPSPPATPAMQDLADIHQGTSGVPASVVLHMIGQAERQHLQTIMSNQSIQNAHAFADSQRALTLFFCHHNK